MIRLAPARPVFCYHNGPFFTQISKNIPQIGGKVNFMGENEAAIPS
jgi:hypothetical protein